MSEKEGKRTKLDSIAQSPLLDASHAWGPPPAIEIELNIRFKIKYKVVAKRSYQFTTGLNESHLSVSSRMSCQINPVVLSVNS